MNGIGPNDRELLDAWVRRRDGEAMGRLVRRHVNLVYAAALRQVHGDAHLAEDVTQAVFILLIRKAHRIPNEAAMASWLFTTTRYAAANALRMRRRREHHEHVAASRATEIDASDRSPMASAQSAEYVGLLDDAIASLGGADRECVVMSFLQHKSHEQLAASMGISPDAARKRVGRAVERLRGYFAARGITMSAPLVVPAIAIAPPALVESTLNVAILSQSTAPAAAGAIAKAVSHMIFTSKLKLAASVMLAVTLTGIASVGAVQLVMRETARETAGPTDKASRPPAAEPAVDERFSATMDGVVVRFTGIAPYPAGADDWRTLDGKPLPNPPTDQRPRSEPQIDPARAADAPPTQIAARVTCAEDAGVRIYVPGAQPIFMGTRSITHQDLLLIFIPETGTNVIDCEVSIADGKWVTSWVAGPKSVSGEPRRGVLATAGGEGGAIFGPLESGDNGISRLWLSFEGGDVSGPDGVQWRVACVDVNGQQHLATSKDQMTVGRITGGTFIFNLPADQIREVQIQTRPYAKRAVAKGISLDPSTPTKPTLSAASEPPARKSQ